MTNKKRYLKERPEKKRAKKCKVYDNEIMVNELTRQQKEITEKFDFLVPKKLGI